MVAMRQRREEKRREEKTSLSTTNNKQQYSVSISSNYCQNFNFLFLLIELLLLFVPTTKKKNQNENTLISIPNYYSTSTNKIKNQKRREKIKENLQLDDQFNNVLIFYNIKNCSPILTQ